MAIAFVLANVLLDPTPVYKSLMALDVLLPEPVLSLPELVPTAALL
jgi:hypothetical protein